ncbi:MAG: M2 family metallopeptidase, partial [Steroidobacteraceae bacterium]
MANPAHLTYCAVALACAISLGGCGQREHAATPAEATAFVAKLNQDMTVMGNELGAAGWVQATYINTDTQLLNSRANERLLEYFSKTVKEARRFDGLKLDEPAARALMLLKQSDMISAPAPDDAAKRSELATIMARLEATYGEGKYCVTKNGKQDCRNIDQAMATLAKSRNYDELTEAWVGWHGVGAPMRKDYIRFVELANEGAKELGYADLGALWRGHYDMTPEQFDAEVERLWNQVKPLYDDLQCYARAQLAKKYGEDKVPAGKPIPAQLFGNLWAQQWNNIYDDILKPYPAVPRQSIDAALVQQKYTAERMTQQAESFYTSLGFRKLPATFWERSMLTRPRDREVVCHASAWHMDAKEDVRIKTCTIPTGEELETLYHELGHVYYYLSYNGQPYMFQGGAHDGFHEAIGDTVVLSMTPAYLAQVGLGSKVTVSKEAVINEQMKMAADKVAFLPFGKVIDQWRWKVFSGEITPANYNDAWWDLKLKYQGVVPPVERSEADFDPGAKYHVPGNTPYTRYFLAHILQFQFHRALCAAAGQSGPLHRCSIYGNREAGKKLEQMLALGVSRPWPEALAMLG